MYNTKLEKYLKDNIEFDLVGTDDNTAYIFEIKWRNKKTSYKDINNLVQKISNSEFRTQKKRVIFISKSGYTQSALESAGQHEVELLNRHMKKVTIQDS
ncbi:MAG: hypothetical protein GQ533_13825 [Methanosarcinaceae archaeon]|nr:hypothetical protein [Methanosarcinaceae archaeon]